MKLRVTSSVMAGLLFLSVLLQVEGGLRQRGQPAETTPGERRRAALKGGRHTYCAASFLREKQIPRSAKASGAQKARFTRDDSWTESALRGVPPDTI